LIKKKKPKTRTSSHPKKTSSTNQKANNDSNELRARSKLLRRFGCNISAPFFYHTALHHDLSSYQEAWNILIDKNRTDGVSVGAHFVQNICPSGHDQVIFYLFSPDYSPQDLSTVVTLAQPLASIICEKNFNL